ncbi:MAG TPA: DUF4350 domain-containing protein [Blastocatellia bacterium]|nr:DUF4350 domain-containing protein [Blastocatellia bacterium]
MKGNTKAILMLAGLFLVLVGLNFLFSVDTTPNEESELNADRSSYKTTPYGTHAFYTLLKESGYPVTRFESPYTELSRNPDVGTLVVISPPPNLNPNEEEFKSLTEWVEGGGHLIIIDRQIFLSFGETGVSTQNRAESPVRPLQPTVYTRGVERVALTKHATQVSLNSETATYHLGDSEQSAVLADASVGAGRVVLLTDPYVVANNGIGKDDNVILALNLLAGAPEGKIAFDEYHHGHGSAASGGVMSYFRGTPVQWMLAQVGLIAALLVYTYGRRFTRPLPLRRERRTTNLEFVSSMANITRLARASGLAMQSIYSEFRNRLCRYSGVPTTTDTRKLAHAAARRAGLKEDELERLLTRCEAVARGEHVRDSELHHLVERIRAIESDLRL